MTENQEQPVRKRSKSNQIYEDLALYEGPIKFIQFGRSRLKLLTSNIVNSEEILKEYDERVERKRPKQLPEGGDLIFQKKITKRLAEKIVKEDADERPPPTKKFKTIDPNDGRKIGRKKKSIPPMDARFFVEIMNDSDDDSGISNNYCSTSKGESSNRFQNETLNGYDEYEQFRHFAEISQDDEPQQNMFKEKLQNQFKNKLKSVMLLNNLKKKNEKSN